ncbi:DUF1707 domain-containing protein [Actinomadura sp. SCN-SB]|uniref:DUF1707 SHOCT-like domain-containing protein n=1 Tax=Actinomadura sp. SCN-SB TaxID=3373092 RepID=UPI00375243E0
MTPLTGERNDPVDAEPAKEPVPVPAEPSGRASDRDRDEVLVRLHTAYAEGRLDDGELDERIDLVLAARTYAELDRLSADLPASRSMSPARPEAAVRARPAGRFQPAWKSVLRRSGRWRVPERYTLAAYKSDCLLDLRSAEPAGPVISLRVLSYKSDTRIVVPPGTRVEVGGLGVSSEIHSPPSPGAPLVQVQGFAYKGVIEVIDHLRTP